MINWKVRFRNPIFWTQIALSVFVPILAYFELTAQDLITWGSVFNLIVNAFSNPYVVGMVVVSVWNAINNPISKGLQDSYQDKRYVEPK